MATFDNVVFSGYQILSNETGLPVNINLQGGYMVSKNNGWQKLTYPIAMKQGTIVCAIVPPTASDNDVAKSPVTVGSFNGTYADITPAGAYNWGMIWLVIGIL